MSQKISQIDFSFSQHLYVGDGLYIIDYKQTSSAFCGVQKAGEGKEGES